MFELIFFDTEFTELGIDPKLISIGLVSQDGIRTFYAELSDSWQDKDCSDFVHEAVLPQLEGGEFRMRLSDLTMRLGGWLDEFGGPVKLVTDSLAWDWPWIAEIFELPGTWPENLDGKPMILQQGEEFNRAIERAFAGGLRRHHALDDAKANRLAWLAENAIDEHCQNTSSDNQSAMDG